MSATNGRPAWPRIYLVRHGETDWNAEGLLLSRTDRPLNTRGEAQARDLAASLADIAWDRAFASPLVRARRTAEIALAARSDALTLTLDERLVEMDFGPYEGMSEAELEADPVAVTRRRDGSRSSKASKRKPPSRRVPGPSTPRSPTFRGSPLSWATDGCSRILIATCVLGVPSQVAGRMRMRNGRPGDRGAGPRSAPARLQPGPGERRSAGLTRARTDLTLMGSIGPDRRQPPVRRCPAPVAARTQPPRGHTRNAHIEQRTWTSSTSPDCRVGRNRRTTSCLGSESESSSSASSPSSRDSSATRSGSARARRRLAPRSSWPAAGRGSASCSSFLHRHRPVRVRWPATRPWGYGRHGWGPTGAPMGGGTGPGDGSSHADPRRQWVAEMHRSLHAAEAAATGTPSSRAEPPTATQAG